MQCVWPFTAKDARIHTPKANVALCCVALRSAACLLALRFVRPVFTAWQPPPMDDEEAGEEGDEGGVDEGEGEGVQDREDAGCNSDDEDEGERGGRSGREAGGRCMEEDSGSEAGSEDSDGQSWVDGCRVYKTTVMEDIEEGEGEASSPSKRVKVQHSRMHASWHEDGQGEESEEEDDDNWSASVCVVLPSTPSAGRARLPAKLL